MQFSNSLLLTSSYVLFIISFIPQCQVDCDEVEDAGLCIDNERFGNNKNCYWTYADDADPKFMESFGEGKAEPFLKGTLRNYEKTSIQRDANSTSITVIPKDGKNVEGMAYLFPVDYFKSSYVPFITIGDDGRKVMRVVQFSIEVTIEGKNENLPCCNGFVAIPMEEQPMPCQ